MPIRLRLTLWYIALLSGILILFGVTLYVSVRYSLYNEVDRTLDFRANAAVESVQFALKVRELAIRNPTASFAVQPAPFDSLVTPDLYVELRQVPNRTVMSKSGNLGAGELPLSAATFERAQVGESSYSSSYLNGEPIRLFAQPVIFNGEVVGLVQVARNMSSIQKDLRRLLIIVIVGIGMTLILAAIVGAWLAERALAPVDAVTQAALHISRAEDLSRRLPTHQPFDEIGRLIAAFNEMLSRLDDVFRDQQRFVADVSHELRTPLTALQGNIDLLKRGALDEPEARDEALTTIESEVARLNRLVADLLLLARADGGETLAKQPVELDTLLLDVFRQGRLLANASGHTIRLRLGHEDQATVLGDPDRLKQLFLNLVDNAIKYTQEGEVVLSLWKDEAQGEVRIEVQDTGIGIASESLPQLFRRFYRTDKARSRQLGGTGLGLAIVDWIVQAHAGSISVVSEENKGSTFTVTLPLPSKEALDQYKSTLAPFRAATPVGS